MKTFKLKGIPYYLCAFSIADAVMVCWANKVGVLSENIEETDIEPNRDAIGMVFSSLEEYENYTVEL
jgi:hypothetical protein